MLNSLWTEAAKLPEFPPLDRDIKVDVLIVGGGLAGLLCAWELAGLGADYALIEADRICGGVSRNTTAKLTSQHGLVYDKLIREFGVDAARLYYDANQTALERYRVLSETIDCDFEERDSFLYAADAAKLEKEMAALKRLHIPAELVRRVPLPVSAAGAVCFRNQAQFHPLKFAAGIAPTLRIYEKTRALEFIGNAVLTAHGKITAEKIIVATHFPILNKHGSYYLKMYQDRSYVLALENAPDVGGMYRDEAKDGLSMRNYGGLLLLGGGGHRTGKQGRGWADLENFAKLHFPQAKEKFRWATQDCMTLDGVPYVGRYSARTKELYVATGFNKWGMTNAMAAAGILCDLVQGKENRYLSVFSPSRSILRPQLAVNAFEATVNLLTPTVPRCPHMGCALKWNPQERSWDCPCHGSRFTEDGKLLDNPATGNWNKRRSH